MADEKFSTVRLRTAGVADAARLAALGAHLFGQTFGPDNTGEDMAAYLAEHFSIERQSAELCETERVTWIAENGLEAPVGYAVLIHGDRVESIDGAHPAEVRRIYVDRSLHGQTINGTGGGVGALLLDRCVEQAREWGCDVIWLAVWERNPRAIRFYEKHGFVAVGRKEFRLGRDVQHDFVMARNL
jgi:GNAT superfamily N-acetyltransferase